MRNNTFIALLTATLLTGCGNHISKQHTSNQNLDDLQDSLQAVADSSPGEIGIALIIDGGDTLTVNNEPKYPLMSVFKLHQAMALSHLFARSGQSIDSIVSLRRADLSPDTWSPMLKVHTESEISLPIRELLTYTLTVSDNNASNWMFQHLQPVDDTDSFIATLTPRESFAIKHTEAEMVQDHSRSYENRTSPLGAAILINRLYTDSAIDSICGKDNADFIRSTLDGCQTGQDRILAPMKEIDGVTVGHKTGSGYRDNGVLAAHNDVGFIRLPDGRHYSLAVFVKDFHGDETQAAAVIARISGIVYSAVSDE